jgi:hypothetical protein
MQSAPASLRILQPVATITGADDSLTSINTNELPDGAVVQVKSSYLFYVLQKESIVNPSGTDIVEPSAGPGRWVLYGFTGG